MEKNEPENIWLSTQNYLFHILPENVINEILRAKTGIILPDNPVYLVSSHSTSPSIIVWNFFCDICRLYTHPPAEGLGPGHCTPSSSYFLLLITARKRSLWRLCFYTCLSVILFTGGGSASVHAWIADHLQEQTPPSLHSACWEIRPTSGWYASYCNSMPFGARRAYCAIVSVSVKSSAA